MICPFAQNIWELRPPVSVEFRRSAWERVDAAEHARPKDWRVYYRLKQREWRGAHPPLPRPRARRRRKQKLPAPTVRLDFNHLADAMLANAR